MSPFLIKELHEQVKRVVSRKIALTDQFGTPMTGVNDFSKIKQFAFEESPSQDRESLTIVDQPDLRGIPIYYDEQLVAVVVAQFPAEDIQTRQIITSLAELIIQQFMAMHKPRPDAVDLLLTRLIYRPQTIDHDELGQTLSALGYSLDLHRSAIIIELKGFWDNYLQTIGEPQAEKRSLIAAKKNDIERSLNSFFSKNQDNIIGYVGGNHFLVLKDLTSTDYQKFVALMKSHYKEIVGSLKNVYISEVTTGIGSPTNTPGGLVASIEEAKQALEIGSRLFSVDAVYQVDNLGVLPLIISSTTRQKQDFASRLLSDLDDPELLETLEVFLKANLNLTQTAAKLKVHRNTVIYRLDKISETINRDPREFVDAVELYLALTFLKVFPGR
ncbi:MAG TPA: helix-turn-helix domain-containing protein [Candidatus Saccharimonadales bacterium]|nr:helix-turn-helix domain-containing protein [Candidatus Saccharimonadales bacterium]